MKSDDAREAEIKKAKTLRKHGCEPGEGAKRASRLPIPSEWEKRETGERL